MKVTITDQYVIHPDYVSIEWTPEPIDGEGGKKIADQDTEYTAKVSIVPKKDAENKDYIMVKRPAAANMRKWPGSLPIHPP